MRKILVATAIVFFCSGVGHTEVIDMMRPSASPMMQTIDRNMSQRELPDSIKKQKEKESHLKKMEEDTKRQLRNAESSAQIQTEEEKPKKLSRKEARKLKKEQKAAAKEAKKREKERYIQQRKLLKQQEAEEKYMEKNGLHYKDEKPLILVKDKNKSGNKELKGAVESDIDETFVKIQKIEFSPSQIFSEEELQQMAEPLLNQDVTMTDIKALIDKINRSYIINDYVTSRAYLPPQQIENGVLKIELFEGRVGEIIVKGNTWTRKSYITKRIGLEEGELFKLRVLEKSLIKFNNDHYDYTKNPLSLKAKLAPGKTQGTTDIIVDTNDPLPFHITGIFDNAGRDTIGLLRGGVTGAVDSLTGNRDRLYGGGYFGRSTQIAFADYNIPVNKYGTRVGASFAYNHINVVTGPFKPFDISGTAFVYTGYVTHPLINRPDMSLSTYTAGNYKRSKTYFTEVPIFDTSVYSGTQGITLRKDTKRGIWYTGHYVTVGYYDTEASHDVYYKYEGNLTRLHDFGHGIIGQFRASGQMASDKTLPWIEQYQIGGISNVRGYSEGVLIGRSGFFLSGELITPIPFMPKKVGTEKLGYVNLREMIKAAFFCDFGAVFPYKGEGASVESSDFLASIGPGIRIRFNDEFSARVYWGFGLIQNRYEMRQPTGRFHFELTMSPDLNRILKARQPKSEKL